MRKPFILKKNLRIFDLERRSGSRIRVKPPRLRKGLQTAKIIFPKLDQSLFTSCQASTFAPRRAAKPNKLMTVRRINFFLIYLSMVYPRLF